MPNRDYETAEYKSLHRIITADKRLRVFQYLLSLVFFILVILGGLQVQHNITAKIDGLVDGSVQRGNARALEQKTIAKETTRYITCIFIIPIEQRTPENQQRCFDEADLPGGLTREDFSPYIAVDTILSTDLASGRVGAPQDSGAGVSALQPSSTSSSNPTPTSTPAQSNKIPTPVATTPNCAVDILFIHIGQCM